MEEESDVKIQNRFKVNEIDRKMCDWLDKEDR